MHKVFFYNTSDEDQAFFRGKLANKENLNFEFTADMVEEKNLVAPRDTTILSVSHLETVPEMVISALPDLQMITTRSTGFNHIDLDAAKKHTVTVCNVPTYGENTVAEFAFMLLLSLVRKLPEALDEIDRGEVDYQAVRGRDLVGLTFGVVGTGRIGMHAAQIAKGFGMKTIGYDPFPNHEKAGAVGLEYVDFEALLGRADVVSLHAPSTKDNRHMINEQTLKLFKPTAMLINTARGDLVDTSALIDALKKQKLAGAGLDVVEAESLLDFDEESKLIHNPSDKQSIELALEHEVLIKMKNAILTPHIAFNTDEALGRIRQTTVDNILAFASGQPSNTVS